MLLIGLLAGVTVINFAGWHGSRQLEEGCRRFETMLRMMRAEAANRGRRLRLTFDAEAGRMQILWEPQPLCAPEQFVDYAAVGTWAHHVPNELVRLSRCELTGPSAYRTLSFGQTETPGAAEEPLEAVTFYPDGSSDSAVFELVRAGDGDSDSRLAVVELDGLNGTITSRILTASELQEFNRE